MRKFGIVILMFLSCVNFYPQENKEALLSKIIERIDKIHEFNNYLMEYSIVIKKGDSEQKMEGLTLFKDFKENILIVKYPEKDKGKAILQKESIYYMYFPNIKKTQAINPSTKLFGDFNSSDVLKPPFKEHYSAKYLTNENGNDVVEFDAVDNKAAYQKQIVTLDMAKGEIRQIEFYSATGKLMKKAYYEKYGIVNGEKLLLTIRIESVLGQISVMNFRNHVKKDFLENYFTPSGLSIAAESY